MPDSQSNISRWVTFLLTPLILLAAGFVSVKAKSWFNYDLSPVEAAAYFVTIIGGIAAVIWKWVHNRGLHELASATGLPEEQINHIVSVIEEKLPNAPSAPTAPSEGAPAAAHAPPSHLGGEQPPVPPTPAAGTGG